MIANGGKRETGPAQVPFSRPLFATHRADVRMAVQISDHRRQSLVLDNRVAIQQEHMPPATHGNGLIHRLREAPIVWIRNDPHGRIDILHRGHRPVARIIVDDDRFEGGGDCVGMDRAETVDEYLLRVVTHDGNR